MFTFDNLYDLITKAKQGDLLVDLSQVRMDTDAMYNAGGMSDIEWKILDRMLKEATPVAAVEAPAETAIMKKPQHKAYNGHKNWNHWNVSLWLNNDQALYEMALAIMSCNRGNLEESAKDMLECLTYDFKITQTPDGAPYTTTTIKAAMRGME